MAVVLLILFVATGCTRSKPEPRDLPANKAALNGEGLDFQEGHKPGSVGPDNTGTLESLIDPRLKGLEFFCEAHELTSDELKEFASNWRSCRVEAAIAADKELSRLWRTDLRGFFSKITSSPASFDWLVAWPHKPSHWAMIVSRCVCVTAHCTFYEKLTEAEASRKRRVEMLQRVKVNQRTAEGWKNDLEIATRALIILDGWKRPTPTEYTVFDSNMQFMLSVVGW
jgi:hypothetical protein